MFHSSEVTNLLNHLGHSEGYPFSLELDTAIAEASQISSTFLTIQIVCSPDVPFIFHSEFDNFDQLVNHSTGKGSVHTVHGIMLQELTCLDDHGGTVPELPTVN